MALPLNFKWVLTDPNNVAPTTYQFGVNPNAGGSPGLEKTMTYMNTLAPGGAVLAFEGADKPQEIQVDGTLLEVAQLDNLMKFANKRYPLTLQDDLGRIMSIYITSFMPKRVRSAQYPYKHTYTMKYLLLSTSYVGTWGDLSQSTWGGVSGSSWAGVAP